MRCDYYISKVLKIYFTVNEVKFFEQIEVSRYDEYFKDSNYDDCLEVECGPETTIYTKESGWKNENTFNEYIDFIKQNNIYIESIDMIIEDEERYIK